MNQHTKDYYGVVIPVKNIVMSLNTNVTGSCHATILLPGNFTLKEKKRVIVFIRFSKEMMGSIHPSVQAVSPDAFSERISAFRVSIQTVHEVRHSKIKVLRRDSVLRVNDTFHKLHSLSLVDTQHHVVVQELALLHQDLGVVWYNVTVDHWRKSRVVFGRRYVLLHQFTVTPTLEASDQLAAVIDATAHPLAQLSGIFAGLVVDGPTGQGTATLDDGSVEEI